MALNPSYMDTPSTARARPIEGQWVEHLQPYIWHLL